MQLIEQANGWSLELQKGRLGYIHIDFRLTLDVTDILGTAAITIETNCRLSSLSRESFLIPDNPISLAPILPLINTEVLEICIQKTGHLNIIFSTGHCLHVDPDERYEAWQIGCQCCEFLLICCPGGEVSLFQQEGLRAK